MRAVTRRILLLASSLKKSMRAILCPTTRFNRRLVSYQDNKDASTHRWFKYKEGFSAKLVKNFIDEFNLDSSHHILDPFAGVSTTMLVARELGINATGIEVMPMGDVIWRAKSSVGRGEVSELQKIRKWTESTPPGKSGNSFPHLTITRHAFPSEQEAQLMWYAEEFAKLDVEDSVKSLLRFILMSVLENISYTSKDGQAVGQ